MASTRMKNKPRLRFRSFVKFFFGFILWNFFNCHIEPASPARQAQSKHADCFNVVVFACVQTDYVMLLQPIPKRLCSIYCNLKLIGRLKGTLTGVPRCFPGCIFGSLSMMRLASASKVLSGPRSFILPMLPSF